MEDIIMLIIEIIPGIRKVIEAWKNWTEKKKAKLNDIEKPSKLHSCKSDEIATHQIIEQHFHNCTINIITGDNKASSQ